ncbi:ATP-dependent RNA helicase DHX8 [Pyrenochaeta sp. MPI-SDFR-AT-0127]|nr:ATP-dependent RNA helicase DHX8 [Pyrenochaeta sp. MPI-SDFR-AT-0127]
MTTPAIPYRQIRAHYTPTTITLYQAYKTEIATAAVQHQRLDASSKFSTSRMTWLKPSWAWMLYRSGYSYKDPGQAHILALSIEREAFLGLLRKSVVASSHSEDQPDSGAKARREKREKPASVRVQWDPERTVRLEKLPYRSIQIGVPGALVDELVKGIVKIEDVTERARQLKTTLDETEAVDLSELVTRGLVLEENEFELDDELKAILHMVKVD